MLTIRRDQFAALDADFRRRFHQKLLKMFRRDMPRTMAPHDDAEALHRIAAADVRAATYGIVGERGIGKFAALSFLAGADFDEHPDVRRFLTDPRVEPHHKIDTLFDYVVEFARMPEGV